MVDILRSVGLPDAGHVRVGFSEQNSLGRVGIARSVGLQEAGSVKVGE